MKRVMYSIANSEIESNEHIQQIEFIKHLSLLVFSELMNTDQSELLLKAQSGDYKLCIYFQIRPSVVNDGFINMRDYILERCADIVNAIERKE